MKFLVLICVSFCLSTVMNAQINPKKIIEQKTSNKVNQAIAKKTDQALDTIVGNNAPQKTDSIAHPKPSVADTTVKPVTEDAPLHRRVEFIKL